jgi:DNA-binding response OmpR family regulator
MASAGEDHGHVLVADDDADLLALIAFALRNVGFDVAAVPDGTHALAELTGATPYRLAVLDVNMPGLDGFAVCERVRTRSSLPVIMLSARNHEEDIVHALSIGADDYITKPFSPRTLVARIRALLRRAATADSTSLEAGGATLDLERNELHVADIDVQLTPLETRVLNALFRHAGRLVTSDRLAAEAWGRAGAEERHALKQVVYRLRRKLEDTTTFHGLLETTRGAGYRWVGRGLSLRVDTLHS